MSNEKYIKEFLVESYDGLEKISELMSELSNDNDNKDIVNGIYRTVHTLKGSAYFLEFNKLRDLAHSIENLLQYIKKDESEITPEIINKLLDGFDVCRSLIQTIESDQTEGDIDTKELIETFKNFLGDQKKLPEVIPTKKKDIKISGGDGKSDNGKKGKKKLVSSVVRVNVDLLDKMMNMVGELVLNRNQLVQYAQKNEKQELFKLAQQLDSITSELQSDIMMTRMQPIETILTTLERSIRDLSKEREKEINLKVVGGETELDKTLLEAIKDPILHMVRNSIDHGIETKEDRIAKGKSPDGNIVIKAFHEGGQVTIEIRDDGKGLSKERLLKKGVEIGLLTEEMLSTISDDYAYNLIFIPGLSTAKEVTNISGRGVGMDVVRNNVERIGGSVNVTSREGMGITFHLKIPLTLAIIPALMVKARSQTYAIPQISVLEIVQIDREDEFKKIEKIQNSEFLRLRGDLIPILRIRDLLDIDEVEMRSAKMKSSITGNEEHQREELFVDESVLYGLDVEDMNLLDELIDGSQDEVLNVVILNSENKNFGLVVDKIDDNQEIVVKPLEKILKKAEIFAGATILGDGIPALIIDISSLLNRFSDESSEITENIKNDFDLRTGIYDKSNYQEYLLFRLSDGMSYGIPLYLLNRLEEFDKEEIEYCGERPIIWYRESPVPVVNLNDVLGIQSDSTEIIPAFIVNVKDRAIAIAVDEILDIALVKEKHSHIFYQNDNILTMLHVNGRNVSIININEILKNNNFLEDQKLLEKRILIVDDSPLFRTIEKDSLDEYGFEVVLASSAEEALGILEKDKNFDLIVSDLEMPGMNGIELITKIRTIKEIKEIPAGILSSRHEKNELTKNKEVDLDFFLQKFVKEEFVETVLRLTGVSV